MKSNRSIGLLVVALAAVGGAAGVAAAQTSSSSTSSTATTPAAGHKWHRHHGGFLLGMTLRATKQLNLTADQQASIKSILASARTEAKAARASGQAPVDMSVLGNPGDANYATALQNAKTLAASRIQKESELQAKIYDVLTAQQKAQLPTVLASIKAQAAARRASWEAKHGGATSAG